MTIHYLGYKLYLLMHLSRRSSTRTVPKDFGPVSTNAEFIRALQRFVDKNVAEVPALNWKPTPFSAASLGRWISQTFSVIDAEADLNPDPSSPDEKTALVRGRLNAGFSQVQLDNNKLRENAQEPLKEFVELVFGIPRDIFLSDSSGEFYRAMIKLFPENGFDLWTTIAQTTPADGMEAVRLEDASPDDLHLVIAGMAQDDEGSYFSAKVKQPFQVNFRPLASDHRFDFRRASLCVVVVHSNGRLNLVTPSKAVDTACPDNPRRVSGLPPYLVTPSAGLMGLHDERGHILLVFSALEYPNLAELEELDPDVSPFDAEQDYERKILGQFANWVYDESMEGRALLRALPYIVS